MEEIKSMLLDVKNELKTDIHEIKLQNDTILNETLAEITTLREENSNLKSEVQKLSNVVIQIKAELAQQNNKINNLETYSRSNNLIFYGIRQDNPENCESKIKNVLGNVMHIDNVDNIDIEKCHRLGQKKGAPIIVRFQSFKDRAKIWNLKSSLKDSKISISEDFPHETINKRKTLFPIMMQARKKGKLAFLKEDKLIVDGCSYSVEDLHKLPSYIDPAYSSTVHYGNTTAFFGGHSPLSNFYQTKLEIDGKEYFSVEQYFQMMKCIHAENEDATKKIKTAKTSLECKRIGDTVIIEKDDWLPKAKDVMRKAMKAKFTQDIRARQFLIKTGNNVIVEATKNKTWGSGLSLMDENNGIKQKWTGQNLTGQILMNVREEIN